MYRSRKEKKKKILLCDVDIMNMSIRYESSHGNFFYFILSQYTALSMGNKHEFEMAAKVEKVLALLLTETFDIGESW